MQNPAFNHSPETSPKSNRRHTPLTTNDFIAKIPTTLPENTTTPRAAPLPAAGTDIIGIILGDFGIWQLRAVLILFLCKIPAAWFMACIIFTAPELYPEKEFECDKFGLQVNQTISADQCYIETLASGSRQECSKFIYNYDFMSLIMQFDLVCLRDIFVAWTQYWHLFGVLVGGVMGTKMMIWISPRRTYFIGMVLQIICGVVTGYARDFSLHCAFRCLSAVCCAIMFTSAQAIFVDITAGTYRIGCILLYDTFWSIGVIFLPGLSWFFNNWTHIYLGITFPTVVLMLLLKWTPESPRWLLKNGNDAVVERVESIVREAADINDRVFKIPTNLSFQLKNLRANLKNTPAPVGWLELWRGPGAIQLMLAGHISLACYIINFMGMLLNIRSFGRAYLVPNSIIIGFGEIVGCFLALHFTTHHSKWKWQWAGGFNILAGLLGCLGWTFSNNNNIDPILKVAMWMIIATIPKSAVSCAQSMILACMAESLPLNKKPTYIFSVVTWARIWLLTAPFLNVLKKIDVAMSLTSYCILSIIGGIFTCLYLTPRQKPSVSTVTNNGNAVQKLNDNDSQETTNL